MRLFRPFVGDDLDAPALLAAALALASHRVVVKRPRKAPIIEGPKPGYSLEGKSSRYDIYPKRSWVADGRSGAGSGRVARRKNATRRQPEPVLRSRPARRPDRSTGGSAGRP